MTFFNSTSTVRARLLVAFAPMLMVASPAPAAASDCDDKAWADYNRCLVQNCGWLEKRICDVEFSLDLIACARAII